MGNIHDRVSYFLNYTFSFYTNFYQSLLKIRVFFLNQEKKIGRFLTKSQDQETRPKKGSLLLNPIFIQFAIHIFCITLRVAEE